MSEAATAEVQAPAAPERKQTATVVTSENLAEFTAKKLGLAQPEVPPVAAEAEPEVEPQASEPKAEDEAAVGEKKKNPKLEMRFSELTKAKNEARAEAERERQARIDAENRYKELEAKINPPQPADLDPKPAPDQFNDPYEYAEALSEWKTEQKLRERDQQEMARRASEEQARQTAEFAKRIEAAKKDLPDFDEMIASASDVQVSAPVTDAIRESEYGPQILYYLAENQDFAQELVLKSLISQIREIGRIEAEFRKTSSTEKTSRPAAKVTKAPPPISPLKPTAAAMDGGLDGNREFHGTYQQWKAARAAGKIR